MRASSFSNANVIDLLNHYFVPVYLGNQSCSADDRASKDRIYREALAKGLKAGTVCAYLVAPDGRPIATAPLNEKVATDPDAMRALLVKAIRELNASKGEPLVTPTTQSKRPTSDLNAILLHVVTRYLERQGADLAPLNTTNVLGTKNGGNWGDLPSEGWIDLRKEDWTKLMPSGEVSMRMTWEVDKEVLGKVLAHFYPPTENTDLTKNRLDEVQLRGTVIGICDGDVRARLEGRTRMKHPFYHEDDGNFASAALAGYVDFAANKTRIMAWKLVTDNATYGVAGNGMQHFGAAASLVSATTPEGKQ